MNRLKKIITVLLMLSTVGAQALSRPKPSGNRHYRMLYFYTYGLQAYDHTASNECEAELYKKYGFNYKEKAGCVVRPTQDFRWSAHNNRVERKMVRRFGTDWEKQYEKEVDGCRAAAKK